jgi:hypothetical protein
MLALADGIQVQANMVFTQVGTIEPQPRTEVASVKEVTCMMARVENKNVPQGMVAERFIVDSGANKSVYPNKRAAYSFCAAPVDIKTANGSVARSEGVGKLSLYTPGLQPMTGFDKVLFCKSVAEKLVSVGELCDTGVVCVFDNQQLTTYKKSEVRIEGTKITCDERDPKSRLYPMTLLRKKGETVTEAMAMTVVVSTTDLVQEIGNMETLPATVGEAGIPSALLAKVYLKPGLSEIDRYHAKFGDIGVKYLKRCLPKLKIPNQYRCDVVSMEKYTGLDTKHAKKECDQHMSLVPASTAIIRAPTQDLYLVLDILNSISIGGQGICGLLDKRKRLDTTNLPPVYLLMPGDCRGIGFKFFNLMASFSL